MNIEIYKTISRRFFAILIDGLIFLPLIYAESFLTTSEIPKAISIIGLILYYAVSHCYSIIFHAYFGQTVGKMFMKVRVLDLNGEQITLKQAIFRDIQYFIFSFCFISSEIIQISTVGIDENFRGTTLDYVIIALFSFWAVAEIIVMLSNEKRRTIHDYIAGTVVVKTNI